MTKMVEEEVEAFAYCCGESFEVPLLEAATKLAEVFNNINPAYRDSAVLKVYTYPGSDSVYADVRYQRPQTQEEIEEDAAYCAARLRREEAFERARYEELKAKYG